MEFEIPDAISQIEDIKAIYDMNDRLSLIPDADRKSVV